MKQLSICITSLLLCTFFHAFGQQQKLINHQSQTWFSINSNIKLKGKFSLLADVHVRRNNFIADPSFYILRGAINYQHSAKVSFAMGYGHMWLAPSIAGYTTFSNENRLYQQLQVTSKTGKLAILQKIRNEQRWQEIIVADESTHTNKFSDRLRYLVNLTLPVSKNKDLPSLVVAEELCIQFGKEIVTNTFDQNRLFLGIKQPLGKHWSFDIGYMYVFQQKSSGYQYDANDTFRCFFYYTTAGKK
jgi:hypothetical protein